MTIPPASSPISPEIIASHGLNDEEYAKILTILGRSPNITELGIFSVMWSEHCSYKSSKKWLKTLPTTAPWVICGPGENAGVIDIGEGLAAIFKMESHNHPSFIEPYQGAATGVGGIMRDVFTMGARPIANLNALRFGDPSHPKTRHLVKGVVAGIGGYGNCVGVPTVGGETNFHASFNGNILVNAMTVGLARKDRIFYSTASGVGNPVIYVGSKTGRDGIHGATMASAEFVEGEDEKRPTVQVGDPFTEKLLIEACLELMETGSIIAIQDMGAAGLTSSSFEMASKGGLGIAMNLDLVPMRESHMSAYEIMLSESQERMLMILKPGQEEQAKAIFTKWDLDFAVIGTLTDTGRMVLTRQGEVVADLPIDPLAKASPEYDRPWVSPPKYPLLTLEEEAKIDTLSALKILLSCPDLASKKWIWEQYDHMIMNNTMARPGGDAAIIRLSHSNRGLAMTVDCTPRYVQADPRQGARQAVAEAWRNLNAVGARPLALTDNLNFGNPEKPEIMGQIVESIQGIAEACRDFNVPVVSGNVSLYNETNGQAIQPTPAIGMVGLIDSLDQCVTSRFQNDQDCLVLIGETKGWLGSSLYLREVLGREEGAPPPVALHREKREGEFIRDSIHKGYLTAAHDLSDGGLLVAIAEMALSSGKGVTLNPRPKHCPSHAWWFGEDQGRYLVTIHPHNLAAFLEEAHRQTISALSIGQVGGKDLTLHGEGTISLEDLRTLHEGWLPDYMAQ
jgi:phosphoribosylformylglycinamidine synthase